MFAYAPMVLVDIIVRFQTVKQSNPCQNGATCTNAGNSLGYTCKCLPGYSGTNCQISN